MRALASVAVSLQFLARNRMEEPEYNVAIHRVTWREMLLTPLWSKPFLITVLIAILWSFGTTFAGTYYSAYLLDGAGLSCTYISICGMIGLPLNIYLLPRWNKAINVYGWLPALSVSMALYGICFALNALVTEQSAWIYLFFTVYCISISGGVTLGQSISHFYICLNVWRTVVYRSIIYAQAFLLWHQQLLQSVFVI